MEETVNQIINYIIAWGPSVVSIITMICTVIVAIKKVGKSNDTNLQETRRLEAKMNSVLEENADLKKVLKKCMRKIHNIRED